MAERLRDGALQSFYRVRRVLGLLGLFLPLMLILGSLILVGTVEPSISDYYHTIMGDLLVGTLCAIAIFLICYHGHAAEPGDRVSDNAITTIAGLGALGVAFFPNASHGDGARTSFLQNLLTPEGAATGHYVSAMVFLSALAWLSYFRFGRTSSVTRRRIYRLCGLTIFAMTLATFAASWFKIIGPEGPRQVVTHYVLILWFEAIAVWAFALSWLTKGRADQTLIAMVHREATAPSEEEDRAAA